LAAVMLKRGWMPIIAEHTMIYRRPLGVFKRFRATMHLTHWDEKYFYMTHHFTINEKLIAEGTSKGVVRGREGVIAPDSVFAAIIAARHTATT
jgi:acyl-CoA thioesterase FadM